MAGIRRGCTLALSLLVFAAAARAADQPPAAAPGLYDRPVLAIDPGMHIAEIKRAAVDAQGHWAVTGSDDKTLRVWSLTDGALERMIRLPAGPGNVGMVYGVAITPDGTLIAAGGPTRWTEADPQEQIYLFDRATGALVQRIQGLRSTVTRLAFSPDGHVLAAVGWRGLRVYARQRDWAEIARDEDYGAPSWGVAFALDGRLATTSYDRKVRLYAGSLEGNVRSAATITVEGRRPDDIEFSPNGTRLAIGYHDDPVVDLLDGRTLAALPKPDLAGIDNGDLSTVAWSLDGRTLFAASGYSIGDGVVVLSWSDAGDGTRSALLTTADRVTSLVPLPDGDLLLASRDPWLARLQPDGGTRWAHAPPKADFRRQYDTLSVSSDGTFIDFGFAYFGKMPARFDLAARALSLDPPPDGRTAAPRQHGLPIDDWLNSYRPTLGGRPLALEPYEFSRSLAVHPAGDRFVLGTEWHLRAFDAKGAQLWERMSPGRVWAVNITGDGRLIVAAYGDGTIRWHRMADGVELLAFMPLPDRTNWVAWTPEGFYASTAGAQGILRWHINRGWDAPADEVAVQDIPGSFRPAVLPLVLQELETPRALGLAVLAEHSREVALRTHSRLPPGVQLHLLTIGISAYNGDYAKNLRLDFADRDASDLASAIIDTQEGSLYTKVNAQVLLNKDANKGGILRALATMRAGMERSGGNDLAVVHFSGHGALVDDKLYLLPYDIDARDPVGIKANGLPIDELRGELLELAKHGRVLVLLDACHSGATTVDGAALAMDSTALRTGLAAANVTVITSSSGREVSRENATWQHGAFTKELLDAFNDPAADPDHVGLISTTALAHYIANHVSSLTGGAQNPGMEVRFETTVFASGM
jgi:WD40 repeat protein